MAKERKESMKIKGSISIKDAEAAMDFLLATTRSLNQWLEAESKKVMRDKTLQELPRKTSQHE